MLGRQIRDPLSERPDLIALGSRRGTHSSTLSGASSTSVPEAAEGLPSPAREWVSARGTGLLGAGLQALPLGVRSSLSG